MRYAVPVLLALAAAGASAPAAADNSTVYVRIGYTDDLMVLVKVADGLPQSRRTARASQFAYYPNPSFRVEGQPIRLTETEFDIDCANGASRRVHAAAYREIGERVSEESYSEDWSPIAADSAMDATRRLACQGLGPGDAVYTTLNGAIVTYGKLLSGVAAN
jgi:hypothetical protein